MPRRSSAAAKTERLYDGYTLAELKRKFDLERRLYGGEGGLRGFIQKHFPEHYPPPRHLDPLIDALEKARHERVRVCLSMPPGHAKTVTILRAIAWWLAATPQDTCAYISYADKRAWSKSKECRDIAEGAGVELNPYAWSGQEWRTIQGGGLLAAGVGGRLTGERVTGFAVVDDPFKGPDDVASEDKRNRVWNFFTAVVRTRLEHASVIVVHTRWHDDDLIGRLAKKAGWIVINLPAIAEPNNDNGTPDPLGREEGEALWPEMYPVNDLVEIKEEVGEYVFSALFQGRPVPRGKAIFGPEHYYDQHKLDLTGCRIVLACDPAATDDTVNDYSTIVVLAMRGQGVETHAYVLDVYREQVTIPQFARDLRAWQVKRGNPRVAVESNGAFKAVPQLLKEADPSLRVKSIIAMVDKWQRAQGVAAAWNAARVLVPLPTDEKPVLWLKEFLAEVTKFTGVKDKHDDQVDALAHAWNSNYIRGHTGDASDSGPIQPRRM